MFSSKKYGSDSFKFEVLFVYLEFGFLYEIKQVLKTYYWLEMAQR